MVSLPLLNKDNNIPSKAKVTSVNSSNSIGYTTLNTSESGSATIPNGYLSNPAEPYLIHFTTGNAAGFMLLVSSTVANTTSNLTLTDPHDTALNLANMGVAVNDEFRIYPCDTLLSFFGTPAQTNIRGGTSANQADNITLITAGSASTYFYHTGLNRWARVGLGNPNANNTPLLPFYGIQYGRLAPTPLQLVATGEVPLGKRKAKIRGNGSTLLATYWPVDTTLSLTSFRNIGSWRTGNAATNADRLVLSPSGSANTYWHTGTNWRRTSPGSPISDSTPVSLGTAALINKTTPGVQYTVLEDLAPYNF
jgi:hypothetical protein